MRKRKKWTEDAPSFAFSIESFADAHEIGRSKVFEEIKAGRLKARKVDNRTIITSEDAADWRANLPLAGDQQTHQAA
jgi:hypothetical protein